MLITRTSILTNKEHTREIPVTEEQLTNWQSGLLIQHAMPNLSDDDREFIMNGITPEEWDSEFEEEHDEQKIVDYWADWIVDAVSVAAQDSRLIRGDSKEDKVLTKALEANARKAIINALEECGRTYKSSCRKTYRN